MSWGALARKALAYKHMQRPFHGPWLPGERDQELLDGIDVQAG